MVGIRKQLDEEELLRVEKAFRRTAEISPERIFKDSEDKQKFKEYLKELGKKAKKAASFKEAREEAEEIELETITEREARKLGLVPLTVWLNPLEVMDTQHGVICHKKWLKLEKERIESVPGRVAKIVKRGGPTQETLCLFTNGTL